MNEKKEAEKRTREEKRKTREREKNGRTAAIYRWSTEYIDKNKSYWEHRRKAK